jgi:hypothetical protein
MLVPLQRNTTGLFSTEPAEAGNRGSSGLAYNLQHQLSVTIFSFGTKSKS